MTLPEMIDEVYRLLDKDDSPEVDGIHIVSSLNQFISEYVDRKYLEYEQSQMRIDQLQTLVVPDVSMTFSSPNYQFPDDYRHSLKMFANVTNLNCNTTIPRTKLTFVQQDDIEEALTDPFVKPNKKECLYTIDKNGVLVYSHPSVLVNSVFLTYLREPVKLDFSVLGVSCDLPRFVHPDIVNGAVRIIMEITEQNRLNTFTQQSFIQEN